MIDRYLLRYFLAVLDQGSFSRAAQHLNVAQPSLSIGIRKLEGLLGVALFTRTSKRVHLTDAGTRLAPHARRIESEFNLATAAVLDIAPTKVLRLGVVSSFPIEIIGKAIRDIRRSGDPERLQIVSGTERELQQGLARAQLDVALTIVRTESARFVSEPLMTEPYSLALHSGHPLAKKRVIGAEELAEEPMIVRRHCEALSEISKHFTERGVRPFFAYRDTQDERIIELVKAGVGLTVMPACYSRAGVVRPQLAGFNLERTIGFVYANHAEGLAHSGSALLKAVRARLASK